MPRCRRAPAFSKATLRLRLRASCFAERQPRRRWPLKKAPPPASAHLLHHQLPPLISQKKTPSLAAPPAAFSRASLRLRPWSCPASPAADHDESRLPSVDHSTQGLASRMGQGARSAPVFPIHVFPPLGSPMDGGRSMCGGPLWNIHGRRPYGGRSMGGGTKHAAGGGSHTRLPESYQTKLPLDYLTTWSESPPLGWDASVLLPVHEIIMPCSPWAAGQKGTQQLMHTWAKKKRGILRSFCTIHDCTTRESNFYASAPQGSQFQLMLFRQYLRMAHKDEFSRVLFVLDIDSYQLRGNTF
ncbi:unnamed protein product [Urochloa humidicola]